MEHVNVSRVGQGRVVIKVLIDFLKACRQGEQVDLFRSNSLLKKLSFRIACEKNSFNSKVLHCFVFVCFSVGVCLFSFSLVSWLIKLIFYFLFLFLFFLGGGEGEAERLFI